MTKKIIVTLLTIIFLICIVGCNNADNSNDKSDEKQSLKEDSIRIEDIDWNVDERVIDGDKCLSFNYTNNTEYTIVNVELKFTQKKGIASKELDVFNYLKNQSWTDEEISEIYLLGYNLKHADPGETVEDTPCMIKDTSYYPNSITQYNIMQPNELTLKYIGSDDKIHKMGYDYINDTYIKSNDIEELYVWKENNLSKLIQKPDAKVVTSHINNDKDEFYFDIWGQNRENYEKYIDECKNKGFNIEEEKFDNSWKAKNSEGYIIDIGYTSTREKISGSIK